MRLLGYVRVSRVAGREGESFISPAAQRERIEAHAKAAGHKVIDVLTDLDQSGGKYERPAFQEALARVERGEADGIIVARLNRFSRSVSDAARALERLEAVGGTLVAVDLGMDTSTSGGRLMRNVLMALAEFELEVNRENWVTAMSAAVKRGVHGGNRPPLGYRKRDDGRLEPDANAKHVRELFRRRAAGASLTELCELLDRKVPKENGGSWPIGSVTSILARRTYLGEAFSGEHVHKTAHKPLVSRSEWEAAQATPTPRRSRNGEAALLAGLIRCEACGEPMTRQGSGAKGPWVNYVCKQRYSKTGKCPAPTRISERRADEHVEQAFLAWLASERVVAESTAATHDIEEAELVLSQAESELADYRDETLVSVIGKDAYRDGLQKRAADVELARAAVAELQSHSTDLLRLDLASVWPDLSADERRPILAAALEQVLCKRATGTGRGNPADERLRLVWRS
jgi:site-specific DNA recombinase